MVKNMIFVRQFTVDNFVFVEFDSSSFVVKHLDTCTIIQCSDIAYSNLYVVLPSPTSSTFSSLLKHGIVG